MKVNPATSNDYDIVANHQFAEIRKDRETGQQVLFALRSFRKGEKISPLGAAFVSDKPSYLTVQTGNKTHIALHPYFLNTSIMDVIPIVSLIQQKWKSPLCGR